MRKMFSLLESPPPGFSYVIPTKRELLTGHIALLVAELDDAFALLTDFRKRVQGLVINLGSSFSHNELAPQLWHLTLPPDYLPLVQGFVSCYLDIMKRANQENEKNAVMLADMAYNRHIFSRTRDGYNKAMERLQSMMEEVHRENEKRQEVIVQLNNAIRARKEAQKEQLRLESRLHQAQKMEAIGLMAGGVAHDLNNILAGVVGYPDLLLFTLPEESSLRHPLEKIKESGKRAAEVVTDLLTIARSSTSSYQVANLNTILHQYLESLEFKKLKSIYPNVFLQLDLDKSLSNIYCSTSHIKKCLMNLIVNGSEAIDGGGSLRISTANKNIDRVRHTGDYVVKKGSYAVISVEDSGRGIAGTHLNHIFEPFYSRKKMGRSGTGLGLTVVWNTVQDHGGAVQVESSSDGTLFELFFPVSGAPLSVQSEELSLELLRGNQETIMVVDDEKLLLDIAENMLEKLGYRVITMGSGEEAISYVRHHDIDLMVLDMMMDPGISGRQTYEKILTFRPDQRAVIASGFAENEDTIQVLNLGASELLRKPYTVISLGKAVRDALEQRGRA